MLMKIIFNITIKGHISHMKHAISCHFLTDLIFCNLLFLKLRLLNINLKLIILILFCQVKFGSQYSKEANMNTP